MTEQDAITKGYICHNNRWYMPKCLGGRPLKLSLELHDKSNNTIFRRLIKRFYIQVSKASEAEPFWKYTEEEEFEHRFLLSVQIISYPHDIRYKCLQISVGAYRANMAII